LQSSLILWSDPLAFAQTFEAHDQQIVQRLIDMSVSISEDNRDNL